MRSLICLVAALGAGLGAGCGSPTRRVFSFDEDVKAANDIIAMQPPLEGDDASYTVPRRKTIYFADQSYTHISSAGFDPYAGPYQNESAIFAEELYRSPYFIQKSNDETLPDAGTLRFDVEASHRRVPVGGGMVWVRARISAPSIVAPRNEGMNVVIVVDVSESMKDPGKLALVRAGAHSIISQMLPSDQVGLVAFNDGAEVLVPSGPATDHGVYFDALDSLRAGGSANLGAGLYAGFDELEGGRERGGAPGQLVLISDGFLGGQSGWRSVDLVRTRRHVGHRLNAFAVGESADPSLLVSLTEAGDGRFAALVEERAVPHVVAREMQSLVKTFAKNVRLRIKNDDVRVLAAYGGGLRESSPGAREFVLGDFASGEERSVLLRLKVPELGSRGHMTVLVQLHSERTAPKIRRTMREWAIDFRGDAQFGDPNPTVESHATLLHGLDYLRRALDGEGDVFFMRVSEIRAKDLPSIRAIAAADGDPELLALASRFDEFAGRLERLRSGNAGDDSFANLRREFYYSR